VSAAVGPAVSKVGAALRDHGSRIDSHRGYWMVQCPVHEDRKASLSLAQGDAGAVLYCQAGCETSAILDVLKLGWADLFDEPRKAREQAPRRVVAEYKYTDEDGELLFVKVRYEPKDFRVKRPDGRGGWTYKLGGTRRVMYRLPDVLAAIRDRKTVFLVEGEKDADRLAGLGYTATCNFDGAAKAGYRPKWRPEYGDMLREADVVIVRDRDEAGEGHARAAYADLKAKAASVRVVQAAVTSKGADLSDHLNAGHSVSDLEPVEDSIDAGSAQADTHLPGIPEYPVDALTGPLREIVDAGLAAGLPAALVGGAALGALATVCGQADLAIYETWTVRPCLWVAMIAPPGGGKTPAITLARRMLRDLDAKMHASYTDDLQMWLATPAKDRGEPPADPTRLINDITIEMVARWLAAGDGTGGVDADELTEWLRSLSKYRQGGGTDAARWLGLWSTQPWRYQRVGAHIDLLVRRPVITVCGGIQPQFLPLLGREGDGMRPRWLPHMSLTTDLDPRAGRPAPGWDAAITKLYENRNSRTWTLSERSLDLWRKAQRRWKSAQRGLESPSVTAALAKADEQAARIALIAAESLDPAAGGEVPAKAVTAAIAIIDYTLAVWRALPGGEILALSRRDAELGDAVDKLAEWLERHGGGASTRNILLAHVAGIRTAAKLAEVLSEYEATYPGSVRQETPEERQGKRGPVGTIVTAPRRDDGKSPTPPSHVSRQTVDGNNSPNVHTTRATGNIAGQGIGNRPGETVDSGDSFSANSYVATVSATDSSNGEQSPGELGDEFWAHDDAPEPAAEPSALALIHDVLGGEVIAAEGDRRPPIRWRDDGIPAIGDRDPAA
jgi:hypothetical protein